MAVYHFFPVLLQTRSCVLPTISFKRLHICSCMTCFTAGRIPWDYGESTGSVFILQTHGANDCQRVQMCTKLRLQTLVLGQQSSVCYFVLITCTITISGHIWLGREEGLFPPRWTFAFLCKRKRCHIFPFPDPSLHDCVVKSKRRQKWMQHWKGLTQQIFTYVPGNWASCMCIRCLPSGWIKIVHLLIFPLSVFTGAE